MSKFELPELPYEYDALEPAIDKETKNIHNTKHHNTYVTNLISVIEFHFDVENTSLIVFICYIVSLLEIVCTVVCNNGGGPSYHRFFWHVLSPNGGINPNG